VALAGPGCTTLGAWRSNRMPDAVAWLGVLIVMIAVVTGVTRRRRGSGGGVGSAAAGAFYDLLQEDKRKAIEIIVEDRAAARDPERAEDKNTDS
jgi:hypothetical protein